MSPMRRRNLRAPAKVNETPERAAMAVLFEQGHPEMAQAIERLVSENRLTWVWDPTVPAVVACVLPYTRRAALVVYLSPRDFEMDEPLLTLMEVPV